MSPSTISHPLVNKFLVALIGCSLLASTASAGMITTAQMFGTEAGTGPGMGSVSVPVIITPNPDNDNQTGGGLADNNITVPLKRFDHADYIDIVFHVTPTNGTTEYKFFESVDNNSGINWSAYKMELGFGYGAGFTSSPAGDGLDFDAPLYDPMPSSSAFSNVSTNEDLLVFSNGVHGSGLQTYQFRVDVPNLPTGGEYTFTLRQTPVSVPEPDSCLLLLGAVASILIYRKHHS